MKKLKERWNQSKAEKEIGRLQAELEALKGGTGLTDRLQKYLTKQKRYWTVEDLSDKFNVGVGKIQEALKELGDQFVNLHVAPHGVAITGDLPEQESTRIDVRKFFGKEIAFGLTADNHLCSRYARPDVLNALFDLWEAEGITTVYQLGNMIDGEARFNKYDIVAYGVEAQLNYFIEHWPKRENMTTYFITGDDHEGWYVQREGINIGKRLEDTAKRAGREDLVFLGHMEHDIILQADHGKATMRLIHAGGGSSYATSYAPQKIIESYSGGEKPNILLIGHYHKAEFGYHRGVFAIQAGATQDQTPFMRKKKIQSHLGGWTVRFQQAGDGTIHCFNQTWHPFFDREYYDNSTWRYQWEPVGPEK